jgi:toxin ParE1/3/4
MKFRLLLTEQADSDLRGIYEYIAFNLLEPDIATRQLERIEDAILRLMKCQTDFGYLKKSHGAAEDFANCLLITLLYLHSKN